MDIPKILEEFLNKDLQTKSGFSIYTNLFLYKDKQLLKENRVKEFAERRISKAQNIFWAVSFSIFIATSYSFWHLIEFGQSWHWNSLLGYPYVHPN